jgi:hypothetical protein
MAVGLSSVATWRSEIFAVILVGAAAVALDVDELSATVVPPAGGAVEVVELTVPVPATAVVPGAADGVAVEHAAASRPATATNGPASAIVRRERRSGRGRVVTG